MAKKPKLTKGTSTKRIEEKRTSLQDQLNELKYQTSQAIQLLEQKLTNVHKILETSGIIHVDHKAQQINVKTVQTKDEPRIITPGGMPPPPRIVK